MPNPPKAFARLTWPIVDLTVVSSLWLASDHVMQVQSSGYNERYQRFQFADIQGFFIGSSQRRLYWNFFWGVLTAITSLVMISILRDDEVPVVSAILWATSTFFLIMNNLLGPACQVHIVTRVQTTPLAAMVRRRKAEKIIARLQPLIEAAQAHLVAPPLGQPTAAPPPAA